MDKPVSPEIYGLIGYPVKHSLSAQMHNAAFGFLGMNAEYRLFEIKPAELDAFLRADFTVFDTEGRSCVAADIRAFNVTIPHKVAVFAAAQVNGVDELAALCGAVNTVKRENGRLLCRNTDCTGFMISLEQDLKFDASGKSAVILGCGGAGRAVIAGLAQKKSVKKIYAYDSNREAAAAAEQHFARFPQLQGLVEFIRAEDLPGVVRACELLVNTTPVGMREKDGSPLEKKLLHQKLCVYDAVYNRPTQLLQDALSMNIPCCSGTGMLLYQGVAAFEFWTGKKAPVEVMRQALHAYLQ